MTDDPIDIDAVIAVAPDRLTVRREKPGAFAAAAGLFPPKPAPSDSKLSMDKREALLQQADVLVTGIPYVLNLKDRMPNLKWAHFTSAGVSDFSGVDLWSTDVRITSGRGVVQTLPIAEMVIAAALGFAKELALAQRQTEAGQMQASAYRLKLMAGKTMGVIGLGGIGQHIARLSKALGMRVVATRHSATKRQENVDHADVLYPTSELGTLLAESDFVALAAPLTAETALMMNADAFSKMKDGAFLLNVARGEHIDEPAMKDALRSGKLGGAYLDVYTNEHFGPPDPELMAFPNVVMTPHNSGETDVEHWPVTETFVDNLRRFLAGEPLLNQVDFDRGY